MARISEFEDRPIVITKIETQREKKWEGKWSIGPRDTEQHLAF
jgi:hypothetical protein